MEAKSHSVCVRNYAAVNQTDFTTILYSFYVGTGMAWNTAIFFVLSDLLHRNLEEKPAPVVLCTTPFESALAYSLSITGGRVRLAQ